MDFSLLGMWKTMGIPARLVVIVLAIMSIYSLSVMAERLFSYARAKEQCYPACSRQAAALHVSGHRRLRHHGQSSNIAQR